MSIQARRMQEGKGELKVEFRSPEPENVSALPLVNLKHILILHFAREIINIVSCSIKLSMTFQLLIKLKF